jgi:hypothetical protein
MGNGPWHGNGFLTAILNVIIKGSERRELRRRR